MKTKRLSIIILLFLIQACSPTEPGEDSVLPASTTMPTSTVQPIEGTIEVSEGITPITLNIWVPSQFDPESDTESAKIFQARLQEFDQMFKNIHVDTRVKSLDGPGGMIDALSTASAAAPIASPDLVVIPRKLLEIASIKGLLFPFDEYRTLADDPDWYDFARQLSTVDNITMGIPFAGDALLMVYRPASSSDGIAELASLKEIDETFIFPATDEKSYFPLALYLSLGAQLTDDQDRPSIDQELLKEVLTAFQLAEMADILPFWLTQFDSDAAAWEAYLDGQADMVISWASRYLFNPPVDSAALPIPTLNSTPFTLANGWVWGLATPDLERQKISIELADFLTTSEFIAEWTEFAGYIPPRPSSLAKWTNVPLQALLSQVVPAARLLPSQDILSVLGPVIQDAIEEILKNQSDPETAAKKAFDKLNIP